MDLLPPRTTALQRKNSLKRRPSMKHTKCSIMRMLKANPLLQFDEEAKNELGITDTLLRQYGLTQYIPNASELSSYNSYAKPSTSNINHARCDMQEHPTKSKSTISQGNKSTKNTNTNSKIINMKLPKDSSSRCTLSTIHQRSIMGKNVTSKRRSVSAERFDSKQHLGLLSKNNAAVTQSMEDINLQEFVNLQVSPIMQEPDIFKTPRGKHRRSIYAIPSTSQKDTYRFHSSTPGKCSLKSTLNQWLTKCGKSIGSFHHLKCFGIQNPVDCVAPSSPIDEENKGSIGLEGNLRRDPSYESLGIIREEPECGGSTRSVNGSSQVKIDYESIAKDALHDLYKLIQDGYPHDQAATWLNMIYDRCKNIEEEPHYWECRAALEQCEENIINAVECYRTAIIKGAEVESVDQSLDLLLQKFSLLNIAPIGGESHDKAKVIMEARNVFKSSIIQFAVQERDMRMKDKSQKAKEKSLYVTPVRRSSRLSMHTKVTPGVKLCTSLHDVDVSLSDKIQFKRNEYLSVRFN